MQPSREYQNSCVKYSYDSESKKSSRIEPFQPVEEKQALAAKCYELEPNRTVNGTLRPERDAGQVAVIFCI